MVKLKTLLLTEGMHGMISQVEGMAKALNTEFDHKIVRLNFPWNLVPPKLTPISEIILRDKADINRKESPLIVPKNSIIIDNSLSFKKTANQINKILTEL